MFEPHCHRAFAASAASIATGRCERPAAVTIDYSCGTARSSPNRSNRIMAAKTGPTKILVVDDDVRLRDLLTRYLGEQGFQVASLADARDWPALVRLIDARGCRMA